MNKDIINYLEWLKEKRYILNYEIEDDYVTLIYSLYSVESTERSIDYSNDTDIISFLNTILISASELGSDIYECLVDENDFYGYKSEKELENRIEEEESFLKSIVWNYKKEVLDNED